MDSGNEGRISRLDFSDDTLMAAEVFWSEKYAMPIYKVGELYFAPESGEWAGYYTEVTDLQLNDPDDNTKVNSEAKS
jgi:hypothetical protein